MNELTLNISGTVIKYGDDIDTDRIYPHRYLMRRKPEELAMYAMADVDPEFSERIKQNGIIVAGKNFGCGSGRDWAAQSIKCAGTKLIIAESFGRLFFRNAINYGLPVLECAGASRQIKEDDELQVSLFSGKVRIMATDKELQGSRLPENLIRRLKMGGIIPQLRADLNLDDCD
jgi:3-isopropylmalate/(R)-2-methylmalate dehydratase small subunit